MVNVRLRPVRAAYKFENAAINDVLPALFPPISAIEKCLAFAVSSLPLQAGHAGVRRERPVNDAHGKKTLLHAHLTNKTPQFPGISRL